MQFLSGSFSCPAKASGVRMRLVVNIHQLPDRRVRIFLRSRERLVPEQFLNRSQIRTVGQEVRGNACRSECGCKSQFTFTSFTYFFTIRPDAPLRQPPPGNSGTPPPRWLFCPALAHVSSSESRTGQ